MSMTEITIANQSSELLRAADCLDRLGAERNLAPEILADMHVALDEVLTNIIKYAYTDNAEHKIRICLRVLDDVLEAVIEDDGAAFDPLSIPAPDLSTPLHERPVGGLGIHLVRHLIPSIRYERRGGRNYLYLTKPVRPDAGTVSPGEETHANRDGDNKS